MPNKYIQSIRQEAKELRKQKRASIKRINALFEDMKVNPESYCPHYEGNMVAEGIKCKHCGFVEKIN